MLFGLLWKNPMEFLDRVLTSAEFQLDRFRAKATSPSARYGELLQQLRQQFGTELYLYLEEEPLRDIENSVIQGQQLTLVNPAFETYHDAEFTLARLCYAICRLKQPEAIVETGVGYGVTSAFFLQALAVNGKGELWSIDLPPLAANAEIQSGCLVPSSLRSRWHLVRGRSRRMLPQLISQLQGFDIFLHDSLHTYRNMFWEFQTVWPALRPGGTLLSDDVAMNRAFEDFGSQVDEAFSAVSGEGDKCRRFGVMVKKI